MRYVPIINERGFDMQTINQLVKEFEKVCGPASSAIRRPAVSWHIRERNGQWQVLKGQKIEGRFDTEEGAENFLRWVRDRSSSEHGA